MKFPISQGTISVLIGAHSIVHSILVLLGWKKLYGSWPKPWQIICIFLHDIGHFGKQYLDDYEQKKMHWILGARIGQLLFGRKAYLFLAGHCEYSGITRSQLYKADKYSYCLAPEFWLFLVTYIEPKLNGEYSHCESVFRFREQVRQSIESGAFSSTHEIYMERCGQKQSKEK